jgi:hypothetical protein
MSFTLHLPSDPWFWLALIEFLALAVIVGAVYRFISNFSVWR